MTAASRTKTSHKKKKYISKDEWIILLPTNILESNTSLATHDYSTVTTNIGLFFHPKHEKGKRWHTLFLDLHAPISPLKHGMPPIHKCKH